MKTQLTILVCFLSFSVEGKKVPSETPIPVEDSVNQRIVGGSLAPVGAFPYQASLRDSNNFHFCGGSIIGLRWILTAAHCVVSGPPAVVVVGTNHIKEGGFRYFVEDYIFHPSFNQKTLINDIALIFLVQIIAYNERVRPIKLPTKPTSPGAVLMLTGWGRTSYPGSPATYLQYIQLQSIGLNQCANMLKSINKIVETQICTLNVPEEGACHGDSGGPLVNSYKNEQVGVVSWGQPCATGKPDVFTQVYSYLGWIQEVRSSV